ALPASGGQAGSVRLNPLCARSILRLPKTRGFVFGFSDGNVRRAASIPATLVTASMVQPILILMPMEAEAAPVAQALGLGLPQPLHPQLSSQVRAGDISGSRTILVTHGRDERFGVDAIGTQPAAVTAWAAATHYKPRLIINAGTAGGFARHGAAIGDVYL